MGRLIHTAYAGLSRLLAAAICVYILMFPTAIERHFGLYIFRTYCAQAMFLIRFRSTRSFGSLSNILVQPLVPHASV